MEILSPVGGKEQLSAAVRSGANAVYLGAKNFNARRNADNFDNNELTEAIEYCRVRNVKVYLALNTLITDKEIPIAADEIANAARLGVDAVIVQDLAMLRLVKEIVPEMPIHASTQMSIHNLDGVKMLESLGVTRVVPARELSLKELEYIRKNTTLELEVFIHGALCMSVSGQCYLSSVLGQRSANRGLCAQPCRLNFSSANGEYALSLKDLSGIKHIETLRKIGIDSIKIEGRMKRPEYVAAATSACKSALNNTDYDEDTLRAVFSRSGFTDGYLTSKIDRALFGYRTKEDVVSAAPVLKNIAATYRKEIPLIPLNINVKVKTDTPISLTASDGTNCVTVSGITPEKAINKEITYDSIAHSVNKCGGTPFYVEALECNIDNGLSVPMSEFNRLRKDALEEIEKLRKKPPEYKINKFEYIQQNTANIENNQQLIARYETVEQVCDETDKIILDYNLLIDNTWLCEKYKNRMIAELPALMFKEDIDIDSKLSKLKSYGIDTVYAQNLYAIGVAKRNGFKIMGGYRLNIINSLSLDEYKKIGVTSAELSIENTVEMINGITKCVPHAAVVYGKMPLMTFRACPIKRDDGCGKCNGRRSLTDRFGTQMTVLCKNKQYTKLINPMPIYMADKKKQFSDVSFFTLHFTTETKEECKKIIEKIRFGAKPEGEFTRGLYYKEIK